MSGVLSQVTVANTDIGTSSGCVSVVELDHTVQTLWNYFVKEVWKGLGMQATEALECCKHF